MTVTASRTNADTVLREIDTLWEQLVECRAHFPHATMEMVGKAEFSTAPYYWQRGFKLRFQFDHRLTSQEIEKLNAIGQFLNENYIVRLFALLESHKIVSDKIPIDKALQGNQELDILRRLRHVITHTAGRYNSANSGERQLYMRVVQQFNVRDAESKTTATRFPLPIDQVLEPMTRRCQEYVRAYCEKHNRM